MSNFTCLKKCCTIKIKPYSQKLKETNLLQEKRHRKAGVFIYDPLVKKVLLVQSRGNLWGAPKGTIQYGESERQCAVREVKEETGLIISVDDFTSAVKINRDAIYFYIERQESEIEVQEHIYNNDANGICWIKLSCLTTCIENGNIEISKHSRIIFHKFLNITLPDSNFTIVSKK